MNGMLQAPKRRLMCLHWACIGRLLSSIGMQKDKRASMLSFSEPAADVCTSLLRIFELDFRDRKNVTMGYAATIPMNCHESIRYRNAVSILVLPDRVALACADPQDSTGILYGSFPLNSDNIAPDSAALKLKRLFSLPVSEPCLDSTIRCVEGGS